MKGVHRIDSYAVLYYLAPICVLTNYSSDGGVYGYRIQGAE